MNELTKVTTADPHWQRELPIFTRFLACVPDLGVRADSIRRGTGFDAACTTDAGAELAFELTEITDQPLAAAMTPLLEVPVLLNDRLRAGADSDSRAIQQRYAHHDIAVTLCPGAGVRAVRRVVPRFFAWLAASDPRVVAASEPPVELRHVIRRVDPRYVPGISGLCFHVPAGRAIWIGEESVATIRAKFEKDYPRGIGLQLLAYFHRQPARPDAVANVCAFLDSVMPDESFERVWIYDDPERRVLLRHP